MLADFVTVAPEIGFTDVKEVSRVQRSKRALISTCKLGEQKWHFAVIALGGHFGIAEFRTVTFELMNLKPVTFEFSSQDLSGIKKVISDHEFGLLVLIMGRIGSLKSQLRHFGYAQMPLRFGAYIGPGLERKGPLTSKGINTFSHRFLLAGIIDLETLRLRLEQFFTWLKQETDRLQM